MCYDRKLKALEMWAYRRSLRIQWTEHVTNVEVLRRIEKEVKQKEIAISRLHHERSEDAENTMNRTCDQRGGTEKNREERGDPTGSETKGNCNISATSREVRSMRYEVTNPGKNCGKNRLEGKECPSLRTCENGLMSRHATYLGPQLPKLK
ncbi:hypothetical protein Trydic_g10804 [Trypoxylus dichotomus]